MFDGGTNYRPPGGGGGARLMGGPWAAPGAGRIGTGGGAPPGTPLAVLIGGAPAGEAEGRCSGTAPGGGADPRVGPWGGAPLWGLGGPPADGCCGCCPSPLRRFCWAASCSGDSLAGDCCWPGSTDLGGGCCQKRIESGANWSENTLS